MPSELECAPLLAAPDELVLLRIEPQVYCYFALRNVTLAVWVGQASLPSLHAMGAISRDMVSRHPEGHSSVVFILDKIPAPSQEASDLIARAFNKSNGLRCVSVIVEGTGFWGSGMRSMMGNAHRAAAPASSAMLRLNNTVAETVAWLPEEHRRRTGIVLEPERLASALRWVREQGAKQALAAPRSGA
jgi:hypothetical protein